MSSTTKLSMILLHDRRAAWLGHAQNLGAKCTLNFNTLQIHVKPSQRLSQNQNFCFRQMRTSRSFFTDVHSGIASVTQRCHGHYRRHGVHSGGHTREGLVSHAFEGPSALESFRAINPRRWAWRPSISGVLVWFQKMPTNRALAVERLQTSTSRDVGHVYINVTNLSFGVSRCDNVNVERWTLNPRLPILM